MGAAAEARLRSPRSHASRHFVSTHSVYVRCPVHSIAVRFTVTPAQERARRRRIRRRLVRKVDLRSLWGAVDGSTRQLIETLTGNVNVKDGMPSAGCSLATARRFAAGTAERSLVDRRGGPVCAYMTDLRGRARCGWRRVRDVEQIGAGHCAPLHRHLHGVPMKVSIRYLSDALCPS